MDASPVEPVRKTVQVTSKLTRTPEEYILERVQYKINRYAGKALQYRIGYVLIACVTALGSAVVPVLINMRDVPRMVPTIVSLAVATAVALESVFHTREHWRNYDLISSVLREEEMRFSTRVDPYKVTDKPQSDEAMFRRFVDRVEDAIAKERSETIVMRTKPPDLQQSPSKDPDPDLP